MTYYSIFGPAKNGKEIKPMYDSSLNNQYSYKNNCNRKDIFGNANEMLGK